MTGTGSAAPFVQGRLTGRTVEAVVATSCGHCGEPISLSTDGHARAASDRGSPLVFAPLVDFRRWKEPSIIDGF